MTQIKVDEQEVPEDKPVTTRLVVSNRQRRDSGQQNRKILPALNYILQALCISESAYPSVKKQTKTKQKQLVQLVGAVKN